MHAAGEKKLTEEDLRRMREELERTLTEWRAQGANVTKVTDKCKSSVVFVCV